MSIKNVGDAIRHGRAVLDEYWDSIARSEIATRYAIIDPIIWGLGWLTCHPAECQVERPRGQQGHVDYALLNRNGKPVILIEAKRLGTNLADFEEQLAKYARGMKGGVGVLTDGRQWLLYDMSKRARFGRKLSAIVDITKGRQQDAARELHQWLNRERWR